MKKLILTILLSVVFTSNPSLAQGPSATTSPELVVHLLDYLAKDYGGAVQNGKVVSQSEYAEQVEFADIVQKNALGFPKLNANSEFVKGIEGLQSLIKSKGPADEVAKLARQLQQDAIRLAEIEVAPNHWPELSQGEKLFQQNCVSCHGAAGLGDGAAGGSLDPKPANFHDPDLVWNSSPYKFYNTIRLGVPGTGMAAYSHLSDQEVWSLAFYLKSLPYGSKASGKSQTSDLSLKEAATLTDGEIAEKMGGKSDLSLAAIASLRTKAGAGGDSDPLQAAEQLLSESVRLAKSNDFETSGKLALRAYLEGIEPIEPKMKANLPGSVEQIESLMSAYRSSLENREAIQNIEAKKNEISAKLQEIRSQFSKSKMSAGVAFGAAFSIFLREGFEAVLIIVVLISILRAMGQPAAIRWVHVGWITALGVGIFAWFASGLLLSMSGLSRELLEGGISLFAVMVLLYVGFWLHRYSEMKKWRAFLEAKLKQGLTSGSYAVLAVVAFMAVFREAFEVVLFLRAIWLDLDSTGQTVAGSGVLLSFVILMGLSYFAVRESRKLPLGRLFQVCSWTMVILALILSGKGVHSLQEAGLVAVSATPFELRADLIGLYPSVQTLIVQAVVILLFAVLLYSERRPAKANAR